MHLHVERVKIEVSDIKLISRKATYTVKYVHVDEFWVPTL